MLLVWGGEKQILLADGGGSGSGICMPIEPTRGGREEEEEDERVWWGGGNIMFWLNIYELFKMLNMGCWCCCCGGFGEKFKLNKLLLGLLMLGLIMPFKDDG